MHREYVGAIPSGNIAVLLIHGIMGTPKHFDGFIKIVPKGVAIHNILLAGHGETATDFSRASMQQRKSDVELKLSELRDRFIIPISKTAMHSI